jgi:hypothetical protein
MRAENMTDDMDRLSPPHIADADKPLRRAVALAYRAGCEAGWSHRQAYEAAMAVYCAERPGGERLADSARVSETIASAISVDPAWFWKNLPPSSDLRRRRWTPLDRK